MCKISQGTRDSLKCPWWRLFSSSNATFSVAKGNSNLSQTVLLCACVTVAQGANNRWTYTYIVWNRHDYKFRFSRRSTKHALCKYLKKKKVSFFHDFESWFEPKRKEIFRLASLICIGLRMKFWKIVERSMLVLIAIVASESIAHSDFGLMGYWLRAHSGSRNN